MPVKVKDTRACSTLRKLLLTVDTTDDNFMPKRVVVYGGEGDNLKKLSDVSIDE